MSIPENDSDDLEALFDSIAQAGSSPAATQAAEPTDAENNAKPAVISAHNPEECPADKVISQIGHMTRSLHDSLRELGYDKMLEKATAAIPDARDRLSYVATMTEQAAERALNATEAARPIQEQLGANAASLSAKWKQMLDKKLSVDEFKDLVKQTCNYLDDVPAQTKATNAQLTEIMMAQDFQDLTGQVIKKITEVAQSLEQQLVQLLWENAPPEVKQETGSGLLNGPVINGDGRTDVVTDQNQVDELLESLGF